MLLEEHLLSHGPPDGCRVGEGEGFAREPWEQREDIHNLTAVEHRCEKQGASKKWLESFKLLLVMGNIGAHDALFETWLVNGGRDASLVKALEAVDVLHLDLKEDPRFSETYYKLFEKVLSKLDRHQDNPVAGAEEACDRFLAGAVKELAATEAPDAAELAGKDAEIAFLLRRLAEMGGQEAAVEAAKEATAVGAAAVAAAAAAFNVDIAEAPATGEVNHPELVLAVDALGGGGGGSDAAAPASAPAAL